LKDHPDILVMISYEYNSSLMEDLDLPELVNAETKLVVLIGQVTTDAVIHAFRHNICGILMHDHSLTELYSALKQVHVLGACIAPKASLCLKNYFRDQKFGHNFNLSNREKQLVDLVVNMNRNLIGPMIKIQY
jgi:DNA-binding NarL/FixJ family response regulator